MKKQLFTLVMMLALVVMASTNVWAQASSVPVAASQLKGSPLNPVIYLTGATGTLQITKGYANSTVAWALFKGSNNSTPATSTTTPASVAADLDISALPVDKTAWDVTQADNSTTDATSTFRFKWTDRAAGNYYLQVTETAHSTHGGCITVRGFHIFILGFDVEVYASTSGGVRLNAGDALLASCGDGTAYPAFMNDPLTIDGSTVRGDILNSTDNPAPLTGALTGIHGTGLTTTRWYTCEITYDTPAANQGTYTTPTPGSITCDIAIAGTNVTAVDVSVLNGTTLTEAQNSVTTTTINGASNKFTFPVVFYDRWGVDLQPTAEVHNVTIYSAADKGGTNLGEEPNAYEDINLADEGTESPSYKNNLSNSITIYGKPATSVIAAP